MNPQGGQESQSLAEAQPEMAPSSTARTVRLEAETPPHPDSFERAHGVSKVNTARKGKSKMTTAGSIRRDL